MLYCAPLAPIRRPAYRFRRSDAVHDDAPGTALIDESETTSGNRATLLCAACGQTVTWRGALISVQGDTEHRFTNPHGFRFLIACYQNAPGCRGIGEWTAEYSWFHNTEWRYALCAACHIHLGWEYRGAANFFGLIRDRLIQSDIQHH